MAILYMIKELTNGLKITLRILLAVRERSSLPQKFSFKPETKKI